MDGCTESSLQLCCLNPLYADDHYSGHLPKNDFLMGLQNLTLVHSPDWNVPHWIHLFLVLETIWCFLGHV